jgi:hypothetical protein
MSLGEITESSLRRVPRFGDVGIGWSKSSSYFILTSYRARLCMHIVFVLFYRRLRCKYLYEYTWYNWS